MTRFSLGRRFHEEGSSRRINPFKRMRIQIDSPGSGSGSGSELGDFSSPSPNEHSRDSSPSPPLSEERENTPINSPLNSPRGGQHSSPESYGSEYDDDEAEMVVLGARPVIGSCSNSRGRATANEAVADSGGDDVDGCNNVVMTLSDPDVLDCPICLDHLTLPVFQCDNGHIACSSCSTKVKNKCPSCTLPIGYNRCRAIEKVIESVKISCRNSKYGCIEKTKYCNKNIHEDVCTFAPCSCPYLVCPFIGSLDQLNAHFTTHHPHIAERFYFNNSFPIFLDQNENDLILQERGGMLFILRNKKFPTLGNIISVFCIKPRTSKENFSYNLVVTKGECLLKLESVADNVAKRVVNMNQKKFLTVPQDFIDLSGKLKIEVNILNQLPKTLPRVVTGICGVSNPIRR